MLCFFYSSILLTKFYNLVKCNSPDPVLPTIPIFCFGKMVIFKDFKTSGSSSLYLIFTSLNLHKHEGRVNIIIQTQCTSGT